MGKLTDTAPRPRDARMRAAVAVSGRAAHALGVRVKSGWATAVLVAGPARAPRVVARRTVEGRLFRTALGRAMRSRRLPCSTVVERAVYAAAAATLKRPAARLKRAVTDLGRAVAGPWRADEKTATLAAWMTLS